MGLFPSLSFRLAFANCYAVVVVPVGFVILGLVADFAWSLSRIPVVELLVEFLLEASTTSLRLESDVDRPTVGGSRLCPGDPVPGCGVPDCLYIIGGNATMGPLSSFRRTIALSLLEHSTMGPLLLPGSDCAGWAS